MKVFKYLDSKKSISETYRIYKVVQDLKPYAIAKYRSWWEDALDEAYFHILENYDPDKGDLVNYATKIVGTIFMNKNRKEIASTEMTTLELDFLEAEEYDIPEETEVPDYKSSNVENCIIDLIPYFVKDFKFFISSNTKDRKLNYKSIFERYTYGAVNEAKKYLVGNFGEDVSRIIELSKSVTLKSFSDDRYMKSFDTGLEYLGVLNDTVIIRRGKGSHSKKLFKFCIRDFIDILVSLFYSTPGYGRVIIKDVEIYVTISGNIVIGNDCLRGFLEKELVGSILSRTSLKVVNYNKGVEIIFSSTKDYQHDVVLPMFGRDVAISFDRVVSKEVS